MENTIKLLNVKGHNSNFVQRTKRVLLATAGTVIALSSIGHADFQVMSEKFVSMQEQPLVTALKMFAKQRDLNIIFTSEKLKGKTSNYIDGTYSTNEALGRMLAGTGLGYQVDGKGNIYVNDSRKSLQAVGFEKISYDTTAAYEANLNEYQELGGQPDTEAGAKEFQLDEIIVTASRREESLQNVAAGITSVNPDDYVMKGLTSVADIIDYTPGVNFSTGGAPGLGTITIRGAGQEAATPIVGTYVDDVPFSTNSAYSAGADFVFDGLLGDIERVEIVKGPQGTLYGAGAVGGVVKYISKEPALEEFRANAQVDLSTTKGGEINQLYRAIISTPIVEDKIGLTVSGFYNDLGGFIDRIDSPFSTAAKNVNGAETYGFSANALVKFSEDGDLKLGALYYKTQNSATSGVDFTFPELEPANGRYETTDAASPGGVEYKKLDATLNYDFEWAELTSVSAYMSYESGADGDATDDFGTFVDTLTGSPIGTNTVPFDTFVGSEKFLQEVRLASPASDKFEWLIGLFYIKEDTDNTQVAIAEPTGFNLFDVAFPSEYIEKAAFANATVYITPDFDVTAGLRYSDNQLGVNASFTGLFTDNSQFNDTIEDKVTTYLFNARYRVHDDMTLYGRVASGYRPAFVNLPIRDPATNQLVNDPIIDADLLWSYEIGAKGTLEKLRMRYDLALWKIDWNEFQAFLQFQNISSTTNAQTGISAKGFEGTLQFYPTDELMLETTFAYTDSKLDADDPSLGGLKGEKTRELPEWTASIQADYSFDLGDWESVVGAGLRYTGKYNTEYLGGVAVNGGVIIPHAPSFSVPSSVLVDFNWGITKDNYTISVYATNLFDEYAIVGGGVGAGPTGVRATAGIARPRTIGVALGIEF